MSQNMTPNRPYLIRAIYDWIVDNSLTPYLLADARQPEVVVPPGAEQDGKVVLNLSPTAIRDLELGNEYVMFNARFGGVAREVIVPVNAVLAVYAHENGQGMLFPQDEKGAISEDPPEKPDTADQGADNDPPKPPQPPKGGKRPSLKVVK